MPVGIVMNIRDVDNANFSLRMTPDNANAAPVIRAERQEQLLQRDEYIPSMRDISGERQDEYVRSTPMLRNALYNVSDVSQNRIEQLRCRIKEGRYNPNGEESLQKLIDIILSTGRKNLRVYQIEE